MPHNGHNKDYERDQVLRMTEDSFEDCVLAMERKYKEDND